MSEEGCDDASVAGGMSIRLSGNKQSASHLSKALMQRDVLTCGAV